MAPRLRCGALLAVVLVILLACQGALGLTLLKIQVPHYKVSGEMALLECQYRLEDGERLYSVKWYKDNEEFYRYVPKSHPASHSYRVDGIKVEHHLSDSKQVFLNTVNLKSSGVYRCEVSAEAPSFTSVHGEGRMEVIYFPRDNPVILGGERTYEVGDVINLNCTSSKSFPPASLKWFVNDYQVEGDAVVWYEPLVHKHGLVTSSSGLRLEVAPQHLVAGRITVRCVATISPLYWQAESQQSVAPQLDNRETLLLVRGGSSNPSASLVTSLLLSAMAVSWRGWP